MRTAEEVLEDFNGFFPEYVHAAMIQYAKEACKEQKILCVQNIKADWYLGKVDSDKSILNAPLPELK